MKRLFLTCLASAVIALSLNAQIYTPWGQIQGASSNNNVGIGTLNPQSKLHVENGFVRVTQVRTGANSVLPLVEGTQHYAGSSTAGFAGIYHLEDGAGGFGQAGGLIFKTSLNDAAPQTRMTIRSSGSLQYGDFFNLFPSGRVNGNLIFGHGNDENGGIIRSGGTIGLEFLTISDTWHTRMNITPSGNIGIGTTNPQSGKLQIEASSDAVNALRLQMGRFSMGGTAEFQIDAVGLSSGRFVVKEDGSVGIGTPDPKSKLAVNGQIRATEVKVMADIQSVPDYVFEADYELRSLEETKAYITENKHLPEIPSAAEIGENGLDLGEMNLKLLKKIEELTLYQIQLLERLENVESELQTLKTGK